MSCACVAPEAWRHAALSRCGRRILVRVAWGRLGSQDEIESVTLGTRETNPLGGMTPFCPRRDRGKGLHWSCNELLL